MKKLIILLLIFSYFNSFSETKIKGKILGENESVLMNSGVFYSLNGDINNTDFAKSNPDGEFEIILEETGFYEIEIVAYYHKSYQFRFLNIDSDNEYDLVIQLEPYILDTKDAELEVVGDFNDFSIYEGMIKMQKTQNGKYIAEIPVIDGQASYQIFGFPDISVQEKMPGTQYDRIGYDKRNGLVSLVESDNDTLDIVFNPQNLPDSNNELRILQVSPELMKFIMLDDKISESNKLSRSNVMAAMFRKDSIAVDSLSKQHLENLEGIYNSLNSKRLKLLVLLEYLRNTDQMIENGKADNINIDMLKKLFEFFKPTSSIWNNYAYALYPAIDVAFENAANSLFFRELIRNNDNEELKIKLLFDAIRYCHSIDNIENSEIIMDLLLEQYPNHKLTLKAKNEYSPYKKIKVGNFLPQFQFEGANDSSIIYSNDDIEGKYTLIDVWASWCGPCIMEIPRLKLIYDKYSSKGFEILSISIDKDKQPLSRFQSGRMAMNWLTAWSEGEYNSKAAEILEVTNIPYLLLVDPNGQIIAIGEDASGENLEQKLKENL